MKLEDQVCSLELAKSLKELGFRQESEFYWKSPEWMLVAKQDFEPSVLEYAIGHGSLVFSAFTVAELGEMFPNDWRKRYFSMRNGDGWCCWISSEGYWNHWEDTTQSETEANARAKMLIYLIEQGIIKP